MITKVRAININVVFLAISVILLVFSSLEMSSRWVMNETLFGLELGAYGAATDTKVPIIYMPFIPVLGKIINWISPEHNFLILGIFGNVVLLFYIYILLRYDLNRLNKPLRISESFNKTLLVLLLLKLCFPLFLNYSLELKGDALCIALVGLGMILFYQFKSKHFLLCVLVGFVISLPVIIKQQYVLVSVSMIFLLIIIERGSRFGLSVGLLVVVLLSTFWLLLGENTFYWTVTVPSDDGLRNLLQIGKDVVRSGFFFVISILIVRLLKVPGKFRIFMIGRARLVLLISLFLVCIMGLIKNGGNIGNIEIFFATWLILVISKVEIINWRVTLLTILVIPMFAHTAATGKQTYLSNKFISSSLEKLLLPDTILVLDSHSLFAKPRAQGANFENIWVTALLNNVDPGRIKLSDILHMEPDVVVVRAKTQVDRDLSNNIDFILVSKAQYTNAYKRSD